MFSRLRVKILPRSTFSRYTCGRTYSEKAVKRRFPKRIFSGIQATGDVHIGNYLGAIKQWIDLQNNEETTIFSIVDMHSITLNHNPKELRENILKMTATLLACGIDPKKCILYQQSTVSMHAELYWILGCMTTMAKLAALPQYKEKSETLKGVPLGIYVYPVLQAADILLYRSTDVPVGQDQVQHIQLAQNLAEMFNNKFGRTFPLPHSMILDGPGQRIKSLRNSAEKMSKSSKDFKGRVNLIDKPEIVVERFKKSITDFTSAVTYEPKERPSIANLITIHSMFSGKTPDEICHEARKLNTGEYKLFVADVVLQTLNPIREEYTKLMEDQAYLEGVLREGAEKATELAIDCWLEVREKVGFGNGPLVNEKLLKHMAQRV